MHTLPVSRPRGRRGLHIVLSLLVAGSVVAPVSMGAATPDKRLASIKKGFIVVVNTEEDDQAVVACMTTQMKSALPIEAVTARNGADAVLKISADFKSRTPRARLTVELPNGNKVWDDGERYRNGRHYGEPKTKQDFDTGVACGLAHVLSARLGTAMRMAAAAPATH